MIHTSHKASDLERFASETGSLEAAMFVVSLEDRRGKPCVLCRKPCTETIASFEFSEAQCERIGLSDDQRYSAVFALCESCSALMEGSPQMADVVEECLVRGVIRQRAGERGDLVE